MSMSPVAASTLPANPRPAVAGTFDASPLVEYGDVALQAVARLVVAPLASLQRPALGVLAESRPTARINQRLVRQ